MNYAFIALLFLFVSALVMVGVQSRSQVSDAGDFIMAGRGIGFWMNVLNTVSIGFAGTAIAFNPGFSVMFGLRDSLVYSAVVALIGYGGYGLICGKFVRTSGAQTLAEWVEMRYDSRTRNLVSIGGIIGLCGILANNIVSMVGVVASYTGWSSWVIMTASYLVILSFAYFAGMWGVSKTGFFQMIIGIIVVPLFVVLSVTKFGGLEFISSNWQGNFWLNGISGGAMPQLSIKYPSYLSLIILFGFFLIWGSNYYWLRLASCRNEKTARSSFVVAGVIMMLFFYVTLSVLGLYAGAAMPEAFTLMGGTVPPTAAFGSLASLFPNIISSFIIISAITAAVSTASTSLMGAVATATRDIYGRMINKNATDKQTLKASKVIIILVSILTWTIGLYPGGPTYLFAFSTAWLGPPAILLALGIFWKRGNSKGAYAGTLVGIVVMTILTVLDLTKVIALSANTHVGLVGFVVTPLVMVIVSLATEPHYYGRSDWSIKATETNREVISLDKVDLQLLSLVRDGHRYMSDLTDGLGLDSSYTENCVEKLDRGGYIEREGLIGHKFNCFNITQKGYNALPPLNSKQEWLNKARLSELYVEVLHSVKEGEQSLINFVKGNGLSSLKMSSIFTHLVREGYITDKGLVRAQYALTDNGAIILEDLENHG